MFLLNQFFTPFNVCVWFTDLPFLLHVVDMFESKVRTIFQKKGTMLEVNVEALDVYLISRPQVRNS